MASLSVTDLKSSQSPPAEHFSWNRNSMPMRTSCSRCSKLAVGVNWPESQDMLLLEFLSEV
eukprot:1158208-Pelagomonas_calceolata.AAC.56